MNDKIDDTLLEWTMFKMSGGNPYLYVIMKESEKEKEDTGKQL